MGDPIEVNYIPDGDDWTVTAKGRGKTLTGRAPGLIAARDRADQLVEKLAPNEEHRTVVHLLNGDAVEFTTAYLTARLAKPEPAAPVDVVEAPVEAPAAEPASAPAPAPAGPQAADTPKPSPKPRPPQPTPRPPSTDEAAQPAAKPGPQQGAESGPPSGPQPEKAEEPASP